MCRAHRLHRSQVCVSACSVLCCFCAVLCCAEVVLLLQSEHTHGAKIDRAPLVYSGLLHLYTLLLLLLHIPPSLCPTPTLLLSKPYRTLRRFHLPRHPQP